MRPTGNDRHLRYSRRSLTLISSESIYVKWTLPQGPCSADRVARQGVARMAAAGNSWCLLWRVDSKLKFGRIPQLPRSLSESETRRRPSSGPRALGPCVNRYYTTMHARLKEAFRSGVRKRLLVCCLDLSPIARSKNDVTKVRHDYVTRDLRITRKDIKSFLCSTLKSSAQAEFSYLLPFSTVLYYPMVFFLARYWPVGEIESVGVVLVSY